ncbi:hypothetical protein AtubIFM54640_001338 [Aspergillus tubingensis]|nr:hypothetical protein AtubIFM54640_001338 [Aspergillus tubingensis]GLB22995.1 hypothetical protein AtubIFM61612_003578 [Aspergillus tubingensis]
MPPFPLLIHSPNNWTSNQLEDLRLVRHFNASLDEILGDDYLPKDGDEDFESLAMEIAEPTENELKNLWRTATRARYRRNTFLPVFRPLCEMLNSDVFFDASKQAVFSFMEIILRRVHLDKPL